MDVGKEGARWEVGYKSIEDVRRDQLCVCVCDVFNAVSVVLQPIEVGLDCPPLEGLYIPRMSQGGVCSL